VPPSTYIPSKNTRRYTSRESIQTPSPPRVSCSGNKTTMTYKARILLVPISESKLRMYEGLEVFRTSGTVIIKKVYKTRIEYYFTTEPDTVMTTYLYKGFYIPVAYIPKFPDPDDCYKELHSQDWSKVYFKKNDTGLFIVAPENGYKTLTNVHIDESGLARIGRAKQEMEDEVWC